MRTSTTLPFSREPFSRRTAETAAFGGMISTRPWYSTALVSLSVMHSISHRFMSPWVGNGKKIQLGFNPLPTNFSNSLRVVLELILRTNTHIGILSCSKYQGKLLNLWADYSPRKRPGPVNPISFFVVPVPKRGVQSARILNLCVFSCQFAYSAAFGGSRSSKGGESGSVRLISQRSSNCTCSSSSAANSAASLLTSASAESAATWA